MASLFVRTRTAKDGSKRYSVVYRRGGRYFPAEHAGTFKTRREANLRRDLVADMLAQGKNPRVELARLATPGLSLAAVAEEWLASRRSIAEGTATGHRFRLPTILDGFPRVTADEITVEEVNAWVGRLAEKYRPGTVRLFVQQLRLILDYAELPTNPARSRRVELPRAGRSEPRPPDAAEVLEVLGRVSDRHRLALVTMEQLGSRVSETLTLAHDDVDLAGGRVLIRREYAKGGRGRWVPARDLLLEALSEGLPFRGSRHAVAASLRTVSAGFHPHDLRHRRASLWHQQGVPAVELAARLGHARPSMSLDVYAHVAPLREIPVHDLASLLR